MDKITAQFVAESISPDLAKAEKDGSWVTQCVHPNHPDNDPSLVITDKKGGGILVFCRGGCKQSEVVAELQNRELWATKSDLRTSVKGKGSRSTVTAKYRYYSEDGELLFEKQRKESSAGKKTFVIGTYNETGAFIYGKPKGHPPLYNLSAVMSSQEVYIVEGEKDVDTLTDLGLTATTNFDGAGRWSIDHYNPPLKGKDIILVPDNDTAGRKHMNVVGMSVMLVANSVKVLMLDGLPDKGDVSDWLNGGRSIVEFLALSSDAPPFSPDDAVPWRDRLLVSDKGVVEKIAKNVHIAFRHAPQFKNKLRFNLFTHTVEISDSGDDLPWASSGEWTDHDTMMANVELNDMGILVGKSLTDDGMLSVARLSENSYDPLKDYLEGVEWDGVPRVDDWLLTYANCTDRKDYLNIIGSKWLIGAVARGLNNSPNGVKVDTMLILESAQGRKKSTLVESLCPDKTWFCDGIEGDLGNKDAVILLQGAFIVEIPELGAFSKTAINQQKSFISRKVDKVRLPFERHSSSLPRRCVFIGTHNPNGEEYLRDPSGNRRFLPCEVGATVDIEGLERDRDQIWGEAVHRYKSGESWWVDDESMAEIVRSEQSSRFLDHDIMDVVDMYITQQPIILDATDKRNIDIEWHDRDEVLTIFFPKLFWLEVYAEEFATGCQKQLKDGINRGMAHRGWVKGTYWCGGLKSTCKGFKKVTKEGGDEDFGKVLGKVLKPLLKSNGSSVDEKNLTKNTKPYQNLTKKPENPENSEFIGKTLKPLLNSNESDSGKVRKTVRSEKTLEATESVAIIKPYLPYYKKSNIIKYDNNVNSNDINYSHRMVMKTGYFGKVGKVEKNGNYFSVVRGDSEKPYQPYRKNSITFVETEFLLSTFDSVVGIDFETTGLSPRIGHVRSAQLWCGDVGIFVDFGADLGYENRDKEGVIRGNLAFRDFCQAISKHTHGFVAHNAQFELKWIRHACPEVGDRIVIHDTMLAYGSMYGGAISLADACKRFLKVELSKTQQKSNWNALELTDTQISYAMADSEIVLDLWKVLGKQLNDRGMVKGYKLLLSSVAPIDRMMSNGMPFDIVGHERVLRRFEEGVELASRSLARICPEIANWDSPTQVVKWVNTKLSECPLEDRRSALAGWEKTGGGALTLGRAVLTERLSGGHIKDGYLRKVLSRYLARQRRKKIKSTYGSSLRKLVSDGRIYGHLRIMGAVTGRMSSSEPNLQNMPSGAFRGLFKASEGCKILVCDYSQIEVRVGGMLADCDVLGDIFSKGIDVHRGTAAKMFRVSVDEVTKAQRRAAKSLTFGMQFGMGARSIAKLMDCTVEEANGFIRLWKSTYPKVSVWRDAQAKIGSQGGLLTTAGGRTIYVNRGVSPSCCYNYPVQGSASDVMYAAIIELDRLLSWEDIDCRPIAVVHDEIVMESADRDVDRSKELLEMAMLNGFKQIFPDGDVTGLLDDGCLVGDSWGVK
jgi:DNA polymerase I-like protein with 3'-5' exonuclease and polymerase domains/predicted P-loop ATPase